MAVLSVLISALMTACDDEFSPDLPQGRIEEVFFAKDTFVFSEAAGKMEIPINAAKYMNYAANITVEVTEESAIEKEHFYIDEKEVKMKLGEAVVNVDLRIVDDTIINESRTFRLTMESIKGGGKPAATGQSCVVVLRNDDYIPEAAAVFDNLTATVREDAQVLTVPFHVTKPVPGAVTVTFAQGKDDRQTAREGVHFNFFENVKSVTLPEGTLNGEIKLEIINNQTADGNVDFDLVIREAEGTLIAQDSLCKVTIQDEDLNRTVRFGGPENDTVWREEAGILEIPLIFEGGTSDEKMITGKITADSLFGGCTNEDFTLETTEFSTTGDAILKVKIKVKDNEAFGDWGFRLNFRELKNVSAITQTYAVRVKDDERILGFKQTAYEVEEGKPILISTFLKGGAAQNHIPISVEVVANGTTALPEQYTMPVTFNQILKGTSTSNFTVRTHQNATREDCVLKLKVFTTAGTASPEKILQDESFECSITIKNTDKSIGFLQSEFFWIAKDTYSIPFTSSGFDTDALVYVKIKSSTLGAGGCELVGNNFTIPAGQKSGNIALKINKEMTPDDRITLEIEKVVFNGTGEDNSLINPDKATAVCRMPGTERIDRTGWTISSFSSEDAEGPTVKIIDGDLGTFWHSKWQGGQDPSPFTIVIDMQDTMATTGGDIIRRKGEADTKKVVMEISNDQTTWKPIGTVATFEGDNGQTRNTTEVVLGRYLRLTINEGTSGVASIAEVYLTGQSLNEQ